MNGSGVIIMDSQTTIQNHITMQHTLLMGIPQARDEYLMNPVKDRDFFKALRDVDLEMGAKVKLRRGDFDMTLQCKRIGVDICQWEKVRQ